MCFLREDIVLGFCQFCQLRSAQVLLQPVCWGQYHDVDIEPVSKMFREVSGGTVYPMGVGDRCQNGKTFKKPPPEQHRDPAFRVPDGSGHYTFSAFEKPGRWKDWKNDNPCIRCDPKYGESNWYYISGYLFQKYRSDYLKLQTAALKYAASSPRAYEVPAKSTDIAPPHIPHPVSHDCTSYLRGTYIEKVRAEKAAKSDEEGVKQSDDELGGVSQQLASVQIDSSKDDQQVSVMHETDLKQGSHFGDSTSKHEARACGDTDTYFDKEGAALTYPRQSTRDTELEKTETWHPDRYWEGYKAFPRPPYDSSQGS